MHVLKFFVEQKASVSSSTTFFERQKVIETARANFATCSQGRPEAEVQHSKCTARNPTLFLRQCRDLKFQGLRAISKHTDPSI
jgi:hypothetical protein